jgi:7-carboxy-7-deazaguanine synthase
MTYSIKEIFYTLQGEGHHTGRPAVFCRFAGCNLWSGREKDRATAVCRFCDTDFVATESDVSARFRSAGALADAVAARWPDDTGAAIPFVVCTGGEPLLQLDDRLLEALHKRGFEVAVETNGTMRAPTDIDWLCVSPKANTELIQRCGDELKLVFPQPGAEPERYADLKFRYFYLQSMDDPERARNTRLAVDYCLAHPLWRLSLQTHKMLGIP